MTFKDFKLNSIRTKLITSLIAICVIPLAIGGFGSYMQSKSILTNKLILTSTQTLTEIDNGLTNYFNGFSDIINLTANNPGIINIDTDNNTPMISDMLKGIKGSDKDIFDVYYGTASKKFTMYPISTMPEGYDPTTRPWYKQALANKSKVVITSPYKDIVTGKTLVGVVQTVEKNGQVVGVIGLDCSLTTLSERISTKKVGTTGYVFASDASGNTLSHPQKELINTNLISKLSFWDKAKSGNSGFVNYTYNGAKKFGVYQTNKLTGWKLVATLDENELSKDTNSILHTTFLIILIMGLISIFLSLFLSKGISSNIKKLKEVFSKASNGDLTVSITASTKDEFKDLAASFNLMMQNISKLMNNVLKSSETVLETSTSLASMSEEVTASVGEVAKAVEDVSLGATEQAKGAQNSACAMENLSNKLNEVSISSDEMDKISNATKRLGTKGLSVVDTLTEKSNKAKTVTTSVNDIVCDMNESAKQINSISETISEITEQTNLLALNASIESARAGEAGKGFAVVAEEIRILAEESQNSTNEIKKIIESIQNKSETAVSAIKSAESAVDEQYLAVDQTHKIFKVILKSIESMIAKVDEVKTSISDINEKKQSTISEIDNISSISQETAAASQETTASTEEISATMEELTKHSSNLQLLVEQLAAEINKFKIN